MSRILVKLSSNWADEMDIDGFKLFTSDEWIAAEKKYAEVFNKNGYQELYVGTNEALEYGSFEEFKRDLTIEEITDEEAATIEKYFGKEYSLYVEPYLEED